MLRSNLETADRGLVQGWAVEEDDPHEPVQLELVANGRVVARVVADGRRTDLEAHRIGTGRHGFIVLRPLATLAPDEAVTLHVRRVGDGTEVAGSPVRISASPAAPATQWRLQSDEPPRDGFANHGSAGLNKAAEKWSELLGRREAPGREGWFYAIDHPRVQTRLHARFGGLDPFSWLSAQVKRPFERALEIGCGTGELGLLLADDGWFDKLDAFDLAGGAISSAQAKAAARGLGGLNFFVADGNTIELPPNAYDLIYANHALHHITDLEHLFAQCAAALRPGGLLFANDYVGPSRMQYSDAQLALMNEMLARLPPEKRLDNLKNFREKLIIERTPMRAFEEDDPSEAPRSAEIVPLLRRFFDVETHAFGMCLTYEVLLGLIHNFDPGDPADNAVIDRLLDLDDKAEVGGTVDTLFANIVARPKELPATEQVRLPEPVEEDERRRDFATLPATLPGPAELGKVAAIEGWLKPEAVDLTVRLCRMQAALGWQTGALELGVYCGKYLAVLAASHGTGLPVVGVDMFAAAIGRSIEVEHIPWHVARVTDAVCSVAPGAAPLILPTRTQDQNAASLLRHCPGGYSFISVDAGHELEDVRHDLSLASKVLAAGGIVALDDAFRDALPGVAEGLFTWLAGPDGRSLAAFAIGGNKLFLCRPERHAAFLAFARRLLIETECDEEYLTLSAAAESRERRLGFVPRLGGHEVVVFRSVDDPWRSYETRQDTQGGLYATANPTSASRSQDDQTPFSLEPERTPGRDAPAPERGSGSSQHAVTLRFYGPPIPAETVMEDVNIPRTKQPPVLMRAPGTTLPGLGIGLFVSMPRRLDCLRGVDLVWANLFIKDGRCCTPNDNSDIRGYLDHLMSTAGLSDVHASVFRRGHEYVVPLDRLRNAERVPGLVMFAGGEDVHNWGMWLLHVLPAALHFIAHRSAYRRLFVHAPHPNMRAMLGLLGLVESRDVTYHDVTRAYRFEEVHLFRQQGFDYRLPVAVHEALARLGQRVAAGTDVAALGSRPFIVRRRRVRVLGGSRRLLNEDELINQAEALGYTPVEPEFLTAAQQVALFAQADRLAGLGGSGLFNTVFSRPGTPLAAIEATPLFLLAHTNLYASCGLPYSLAVGQPDPADPEPIQKRWTVDLDAAAEVLASVAA